MEDSIIEYLKQGYRAIWLKVPKEALYLVNTAVNELGF
jgi:hypothetical protein